MCVCVCVCVCYSVNRQRCSPGHISSVQQIPDSVLCALRCMGQLAEQVWCYGGLPLCASALRACWRVIKCTSYTAGLWLITLPNTHTRTHTHTGLNKNQENDSAAFCKVCFYVYTSFINLLLLCTLEVICLLMQPRKFEPKRFNSCKEEVTLWVFAHLTKSKTSASLINCCLLDLTVITLHQHLQDGRLSAQGHTGGHSLDLITYWPTYSIGLCQLWSWSFIKDAQM